ncbi:Importin-5 (Imp5) (Importin subunit beta-3) (Karyopherin beta-3) (Ran-binding protein 5) (RanBP5) [Durusdinium trenchii]|uniref:Importin-5 (Imp5) (Importin subunit beta-3) (Karyopherin beta-3) (Ran-binding protein 5) (RanBP5) n=1 Tax=Durusdinium trenchii TaxID=1381693 RepID=A0ABP0KJ06_9DINO
MINKAEFAALLTRLCGTASNEERAATEKQYAQLKESNPTAVVGTLMELSVARNEVGPAERKMANVLMRQLIRSDAWANVKGTHKEQLKRHLMSALESETDAHASQMFVHSLVAFPRGELQQLQDIVPSCIRMLEAGEAPVERKCAVLFLLSKMAEFCFESVQAQLPAVVRVLSTQMGQGDNLETKLYASEAVCSVFMSSPAPKEMQGFLEEAIPVMVQALSAGFGPGHSQLAHDRGMKVLESLVTLTSKCMWGFDKFLVQTCTKLLQFAENNQLEDGARSLSLELFTEIFKRRGKLMSTDTAFVENLVKLLLRMQCEDSDWEEEWDEDFQPDSEDLLMTMLPGVRGRAVDTLVEIARHGANSEAFMKQLFSIVGPAFQSAEWRERHAAITVIGAVADPLGKVMKSVLADILQSLQPRFADPEQKVVYIAVACLHNLIVSPPLCGAFKDDEKSMGQFALTTLLSVLESSSSSSPVRCCACQCLAAFLQSERCPVPLVEGEFLKRLLQALAMCLAQGALPLKEDAMIALGRVAAISKSNFGPFYDDLVPNIKQVIAQPAAVATPAQPGGPAGTSAAKSSLLRAAAMSCVAAIAEAVGKDRFSADAKDIMGLLLQTDPKDLLELDGVFEFSRRVCAVMEDDFLPFLPHILPVIYKAVNADTQLDVQNVTGVVDAGSSDAMGTPSEDGKVTYVQEVRGAGTIRVSANVFAVQTRVNALEALDGIADSVGAGMGPFLEDAIAVVLPAISDRLNVMAAIQAAEAAASLLHAAWKSLFESGHAMEPAQKVLVTICTALLSNLEQSSVADAEEDGDLAEHSTGPEERAGFISAFERCMRVCYFSGGEDYDENGAPPPPELTPPPQIVPQMVTILRDALARSVQRRASGASRLANLGYDREDAADMLEELTEMEEEFATDTVDSIGYLLKMSGPGFIPIFDQVLEPFLKTLLANPDDVLKHNSICLYDDMIEFGGPEAHKYLPVCFPVMLQHINAENTLLQQSCIYGVGQVAEHAPQAFAGEARRVTEALAAIITKPDAKEEDNINVTENAVSVLGRIYKTHRERLDGPAVLELWMKNLPLENDAVEAKYSHRLFTQLLTDQNPDLLGPNKGNLPAIFGILTVLLASTHSETNSSRESTNAEDDDDDDDERIEMLDKATENIVGELTESVFRSFDPATQQSLLAGVSDPTQKKALRAVDILP